MSDRIVRKIIVAYDAAKRVKGFKLFDDDDKILGQTGRFDDRKNQGAPLSVGFGTRQP